MNFFSFEPLFSHFIRPPYVFDMFYWKVTHPSYFNFLVHLATNKSIYLFSQIQLQGVSHVIFRFWFFFWVFWFWAKHICILVKRRVRPMITINDLDYTVHDIVFEGFMFKRYGNFDNSNVFCIFACHRLMWDFN